MSQVTKTPLRRHRRPSSGREGRGAYPHRVRIFLAGATGVIGSRLVPLLVAAGHDVTGMTRSTDNVAGLRGAGAEPVVCDVFDAPALEQAVVRARPDVLMHQLTDLPDDPARLEEYAPGHNRIRREGTRNLISAATLAGAGRFIAQSVAWQIPGDGGAAVDDLERMVLAYPGVVIRYGQFYGPGTYHLSEPPPPPRVRIDQAAGRTLDALRVDRGVITVVEP